MKKFLAAAFVLLAATATAAAEEKKDLRQIAVEQFGEVIALVSVCRALTIDISVMSVIAMRAGLEIDEILEEAGAHSATLLPEMAASGGEAEACQAAATWYGPKGSKMAKSNPNKQHTQTAVAMTTAPRRTKLKKSMPPRCST